MAGPDGDILPRINRAEGLEGGRDLAGPGPSRSIVVAAEMEARGVIEAVEKVNRAATFRDGQGIVDGLALSMTACLFEHAAPSKMSHLKGRLPCQPPIEDPRQ